MPRCENLDTAWKRRLFDSVFPPIVSRLNNFAYFYFYSLIRRMYLKANPSPPSTVVELLLGMLAGACARMCTTPVNVITTRQQMRPTLSSYEIFRSILESDGPTGLYAGLPASLVLTVNPAITYGLFERMKTSGYPKGPFARGAVSKAVATVVTYPYIMAKVRLQFKGSKGYRSAWEVLSSIVRENGLFGLYEVDCLTLLRPDLFADEFLSTIVSITGTPRTTIQIRSHASNPVCFQGPHRENAARSCRCDLDTPSWAGCTQVGVILGHVFQDFTLSFDCWI